MINLSDALRMDYSKDKTKNRTVRRFRLETMIAWAKIVTVEKD